VISLLFYINSRNENLITVAFNIYDAIEGKSAYQMKGLSSKGKKECSYGTLKTNFDKQPDDELLKR